MARQKQSTDGEAAEFVLEVQISKDPKWKQITFLFCDQEPGPYISVCGRKNHLFAYITWLPTVQRQSHVRAVRSFRIQCLCVFLMGQNQDNGGLTSDVITNITDLCTLLNTCIFWKVDTEDWFAKAFSGDMGKITGYSLQNAMSARAAHLTLTLGSAGQSFGFFYCL
jgi:hypothetical protein